MIHCLSITAAAFLFLSSCDNVGGRRSEWDNLDYTPVYRAYGTRENDPRYTQPTVTGCINEDLYNCH